jgi:hypothetical protein
MSGKYLTAEQIRKLDEIQADAAAIERTLRVALNFHSNATNQIHKRTAAFRRELEEIHNLDAARTYDIKYVAGRHEIVEAEEEGRDPYSEEDGR